MITAKRTLITLLALTSTLGAVSGQDFFRVNFRAQCTSLDLGRGRQTVEVINNRVLLDQTVGPSRRATHAVVYNPANDSIQVVNIIDGSVVWDVLQFDGGVWSTDGVLSQRLAFAFVPNQAEAVGTVILKERISSSQSVADLNRVHLTGTLQFALTGDVVLGGQGRDAGVPGFGNSSRGLLVNVSGLGPALGNVRVCTGTFTVGRR
ncbi:MAG TPA: hypothetical protein VN673_06760, partial [Clostridia bacterium]|nr:hypothetical protein [Clostridia bacterium]